MDKIKILYTIPNFKTAGSGKVVHDLVKGLDKEKFSPEICCFHSKGEYFKEIETLGVPIHIYSFTKDLKPYLSLLFRIYKISKFFKKNKFDIIHSWNWSSDITEPLAAKLAGIKWLYTKKAMSWGNSNLWKLRSLLATRILVLNNDMVPRYFNKIKKKTKLIYLGVDTGFYIPQNKTYVTPLGHQFTEKDFVIVTIANLVPIKGVEYLINAVNEISDKCIKLLIVGDNKNEYGQNLIKDNKNSNIYFIDKQIDVRPFHAIADLFVIPTKTSWEGLPVSPLEAMSSQRIVIGSNVEGVREVLGNFKDFMFPAKNVEVIISKINWIMKMAPLEKKMHEVNMRKEIEQNFTLKKCVGLHEEYYLKI
ncbi:glycosyltransferase [bacterium]|nr:glycosyltransferase [bacterium]